MKCMFVVRGNGLSFTHDTFKALMGPLPLNEDFPLLTGYVKMRQIGDTVQIYR